MLFYDRRLIQMALQNSNADAILDVGTGQGTDALLLSENARRVVGIDISCNALHLARDLCRTTTGRDKISFVVADAEHLPFRENMFDVVYCKDVLHHVSDSSLTVSEMKYTTKLGGRVVAIEANALNPQMLIIGLMYFSVDKGVFSNTKTRLCNLFTKKGLSNIGVMETELLPRHVMFEYRSPLNSLFKSREQILLRMINEAEAFLQKMSFLRRFSNYLVIEGFK
jgi:ubiquinone/menaquinone biosynthesis C-methylase UbiE